MSAAAPEVTASAPVTADKAAIFRLLGYTVTAQPVADFHNSTARTRIVHAPARTSKSYAAGHEVVYHAIPPFEIVGGRPCFIRDPTGDRHIWIVGPDYKTVKEWDYVWEQLIVRRNKNGLGKMYKVKVKANSPQQGNMKIVLEFPADRDGMPVRVIIEGKSATNPESLQGEQVYCAVLSEAAELDEKILGRYLGTRCQYVIAPTTPKLSAEWLRKLIDDGEGNPALSVASFQFTPHANPKYDWELYWIEHQKAESRVLSGKVATAPFGHDCFKDFSKCPASKDNWFSEQFQGQWTFEADRALPFRWTGENSHVLGEVPVWVPHAKWYVSMDYGYLDPSVALWWACGTDGQRVVAAELYQRRQDPEDFVKAIHAKSRQLDVAIAGYFGDPQKPEVESFLRKLGLPVFNVNKKQQRDRRVGYLRLVNQLSTDPATGQPALHVLSDACGSPYGCPATILEWKRLRRRPDIRADQWSAGALCGEDHAFDAARYFLSVDPTVAKERWDVNEAFELERTRTKMRIHLNRASRQSYLSIGAA